LVASGCRIGISVVGEGGRAMPPYIQKESFFLNFYISNKLGLNLDKLRTAGDS
jgi:hypothetical protein